MDNSQHILTLGGVGLWLAGLGSFIVVIDIVTRLVLVVRAIMRRTPSSDTLVWIFALVLIPFLSTVFYFLLGEPRLGTRRSQRYASLTERIDRPAIARWREEAATVESDDAFASLTRLATNVTGMPPLKGNSLELLGDARQFLDRLCNDIDRARDHCHLLYYIWEDDAYGGLVGDAVMRAAARGVACRVLVDSVGSAGLLRSDRIVAMRAAGVRVIEALPANALRAIFARIDLRNHRKIAVIDGEVAYCGSHNLTHENITPNPQTGAGPWIDATARVRGPAVQALQVAFLHDWAHDSDEDVGDLSHFLPRPSSEGEGIVHLVPSGPGPNPDAIHHAMLAMLFLARSEIIITTPYFVPDEATKAAIINAALRGVAVTLVVPRFSDSRFVEAAARSHFSDLLDVGVHIHQHGRGVLHAKCMVVDGEFGVIGSANFDMRSFWLNFEATLFVHEPTFVRSLRDLQLAYQHESIKVDPQAWSRRSPLRRFLDNCAQILAPLL